MDPLVVISHRSHRPRKLMTRLLRLKKVNLRHRGHHHRLLAAKSRLVEREREREKRERERKREKERREREGGRE